MHRLGGLPPSRCLAPDAFRAIDPLEHGAGGFDMAHPARGVRLISEASLGGMDLRVLHTLVWRACERDPTLLQECETLAPLWVDLGWHGFYVSVRGEISDDGLVRSALERLAGVTVIRGGNQRSRLLAVDVSDLALSGELDFAVAAAMLGLAGGRLLMDHYELQAMVSDDACLMYRRLCDVVEFDQPFPMHVDWIVELLSPRSRPLRGPDVRARAMTAFMDAMMLRRWRVEWGVGNVATITRKPPIAPNAAGRFFPIG